MLNKKDFETTPPQEQPQELYPLMAQTLFQFLNDNFLYIRDLFKSLPQASRMEYFSQLYARHLQSLEQDPTLERYELLLELENLAFQIDLIRPSLKKKEADRLLSLALVAKYNELMDAFASHPLTTYRTFQEVNKKYPNIRASAETQRQLIELRHTLFSTMFEWEYTNCLAHPILQRIEQVRAVISQACEAGHDVSKMQERLPQLYNTAFENQCNHFAQHQNLDSYIQTIEFIGQAEKAEQDVTGMRARLPQMYRSMVETYRLIISEQKQVRFDKNSLTHLLGDVNYAVRIGVDITDLVDLMPALTAKAYEANVREKLADLRTDRTMDNLLALELAVDQAQNHNARIPHCDKLLAKERKYTLRYLMKIYARHIREVPVKDSFWLYFSGVPRLKNTMELAREAGVNVAEVEALLPELEETALRKEYAYCLLQRHNDAQTSVEDSLNYLTKRASEIGINLDEEEFIRR